MISKYEQEYTLWKKCFSDTEAYMDYYFSEKTKDNKILKIFKENELVSMVHLNPYEIFWKGEVKTLYYIVGVCTEENNRKKGYMRKLLKEAFRFMEVEDCPFTYLMPIKKEIYEPFDFHFIYTQERISGKLLKVQEETPLLAAGIFKGKREITCETYGKLSKELQKKTEEFQNKKLSAAFDLYAIRSRAYLERLDREMTAADGEFLVFYNRDREILGTVAYMTDLQETSGSCEVAEGIFKPEYTTAFLELLQERLFKRRENWTVCFLELGFWRRAEILEYLDETELFQKPIIMARVLKDGEERERLLSELQDARVYLNEIV
jgi:hypothetical protein